jgi:hypothetical protein
MKSLPQAYITIILTTLVTSYLPTVKKPLTFQTYKSPPVSNTALNSLTKSFFVLDGNIYELKKKLHNKVTEMSIKIEETTMYISLLKLDNKVIMSPEKKSTFYIYPTPDNKAKVRKLLSYWAYKRQYSYVLTSSYRETGSDCFDRLQVKILGGQIFVSKLRIEGKPGCLDESICKDLKEDLIRYGAEPCAEVKVIPLLHNEIIGILRDIWKVGIKKLKKLF